MNNWYIWDEIYHNVLQEINTLVDVEDQKDIATYVVNDLIHRFDINLLEEHVYHLVVKLSWKDNVIKTNYVYEEKDLFLSLTNKELLWLIDLLEKYDFNTKYSVRNFNELISINKLN